MEEQGLVSSDWGGTANNQRARYYRITKRCPPEIRSGIRHLFRLPGRRDSQREADDEIHLHLEQHQILVEPVFEEGKRAKAAPFLGYQRAYLRPSSPSAFHS